MPTLSRTYRPHFFADVTGQGPITETLRLEIATNKIGHSYLFSGSRGIGKTTVARIFAQALNCLARKEGEPCGTCEACLEFQGGRSLDIIEMDAASNTGVDNIREAIVEHVRFAPSSRKYKVYILDEAHMLSTSAWNALLKTIEEPPEYAVFLFLTTELHKVPATIQSRSQRFDFHRITNQDLTKRLQDILVQEKIEVSPEVLARIVALSDGCLRDAETLLGQLLALGEKTITSDTANIVLPVSRLPIAADVLDICSKRELGPALQKIQEIEDQGIPLLPLCDELIRSIRLLLLAADVPTAKQKLEQGDEGERKLGGLVSRYTPAELADMALMLMERRRDAKQGADPRFCLELAVAAIALGVLPHGPSASVQIPVTPNPVGADRRVRPDRPADGSSDRPIDRPIDRPAGGQGDPAPTRNTPPPNTPPPPQAPPTSSPPSAPPASDLPPPTSSFKDLDLRTVLVGWSAILKCMDERSPSLTFVLKVSKPIRVEGTTVTIQFQYPFHRDKAVGAIKNKRLVEECMNQALGRSDVHVEGFVGVESPEAQESRAEGMVSAVLRAFEGRVVEEGESPAA